MKLIIGFLLMTLIACAPKAAPPIDKTTPEWKEQMARLEAKREREKREVLKKSTEICAEQPPYAVEECETNFYGIFRHDPEAQYVFMRAHNDCHVEGFHEGKMLMRCVYSRSQTLYDEIDARIRQDQIAAEEEWDRERAIDAAGRTNRLLWLRALGGL